MGVCSSSGQAQLDIRTTLDIREDPELIHNLRYRRQTPEGDRRWALTSPVFVIVRSTAGEMQVESRSWEAVREVQYQLALETLAPESELIKTSKILSSSSLVLGCNPAIWASEFTLLVEGHELDPDLLWGKALQRFTHRTGLDGEATIEVNLKRSRSTIARVAESVKQHIQATGQQLDDPLFHPGRKRRHKSVEAMAGKKVVSSSCRGYWDCCDRDWLMPGCQWQHSGMPNKSIALRQLGQCLACSR